jgi:hypothetical protein
MVAVVANAVFDEDYDDDDDDGDDDDDDDDDIIKISMNIVKITKNDTRK